LRSIARTTAAATASGGFVPMNAGIFGPPRANMPASRIGPGVTSETPTPVPPICTRSTCANPLSPNLVAV
jgi:hypothetical protein